MVVMNGTLRSKPDLRRSIPAVAVTVLAFVIGTQFGGLSGHESGVGLSLFGWRITVAPGWISLAVVGVTALFLVAGIIATRSIARELDRVSRDRAGVAAGSAIRLVCLIVGYLTLGLGALSVLQVSLGNLLVGGAVTGVVLGIAAQQTLSNFFAGLVLLFSRPYVPGQRVVVHTGAMGGPFEGEIVAAGLMYTTIMTPNGPIVMPNSGLLGAAIESPREDAEPAGDPAGAADEASDATGVPGAVAASGALAGTPVDDSRPAR